MTRRSGDGGPRDTGESDDALDETRAAYIGLIRHELRVPAGADALDALAQRISPPDRRDAPPSRAPGIVRLRRSLRALRKAAAPDVELDQFDEDLRFLMLFDRTSPALDERALGRLLSDVRPSPDTSGAAKPGRRALRPMRRPEGR